MEQLSRGCAIGGVATMRAVDGDDRHRSIAFDKHGIGMGHGRLPVDFSNTVIPGRCQRVRPLAGPMTGSASNPESRDSPMCNCTSEVCVCDAPRNDGPRNFPRHCERKRSNPSGGKTSVDCFVAIAPRNDEFDPIDFPTGKLARMTDGAKRYPSLSAL